MVDSMTSTSIRSSKPSLKLCTSSQPSSTPANTPANTYSHLLYLDTPKRASITARYYASSTLSIDSASSDLSATSQQSSHTSAHSTRLLKYADDHYPLIETIHPHLIPSHIPKTHAAVHCAREMAQIHNTVIRALNSSYNHCLAIEPSTQQAADFLFFNKQMCDTLEHRHHTEDNYLFPEIERQLGQPGAMEDNTSGHEKFMTALSVFDAYVRKTKPEEYNGLTFRHLIESFAPDLIQHWHDEITTLTKLYVLDSKRLMRAWKVAEQMATKDADLYKDAPFMLGCQDSEFNIDGVVGNFPGMPWAMRGMVEGWFSRRHRGAWKYCPSDVDGKRQLLGMA